MGLDCDEEQGTEEDVLFLRRSLPPTCLCVLDFRHLPLPAVRRRQAPPIDQSPHPHSFYLGGLLRPPASLRCYPTKHPEELLQAGCQVDVQVSERSERSGGELDRKEECEATKSLLTHS